MSKYIDIKNLKPGQEIVREGFLVVTEYGWVTFSETPMKGYIQIAPVTLRCVVPEDFNGAAAAVAAVDEQIEQVKADTAAKLRPLQEKRAQLLQLSYQGQEILDPEKSA